MKLLSNIQRNSSKSEKFNIWQCSPISEDIVYYPKGFCNIWRRFYSIFDYVLLNLKTLFIIWYEDVLQHLMKYLFNIQRISSISEKSVQYLAKLCKIWRFCSIFDNVFLYLKILFIVLRGSATFDEDVVLYSKMVVKIWRYCLLYEGVL